MNNDEKLKLFQKKMQQHDFDIDALFKEDEDLKRDLLQVLNHHERVIKIAEEMKESLKLIRDNIFKNSMEIDKIKRRLEKDD